MFFIEYLVELYIMNDWKNVENKSMFIRMIYFNLKYIYVYDLFVKMDSKCRKGYLLMVW